MKLEETLGYLYSMQSELAENAETFSAKELSSIIEVVQYFFHHAAKRPQNAPLARKAAVRDQYHGILWETQQATDVECLEI